jgi:hypothetical protein
MDSAWQFLPFYKKGTLIPIKDLCFMKKKIVVKTRFKSGEHEKNNLESSPMASRQMGARF